MINPIISIGMPVYNGQKYIEEAIDSILNQTYENFELLISDNASTDRTEDICRSLANKYKRIKYFRNRANIGAAGNYNILVAKAHGDYFRWHNADDIIENTLVERCLNTLKEHPDAVLAFGRTKIIDAQGKFLENYDDNLNIIDESIYTRYVNFRTNVGQTNAIYGLMRTEALRKTHLFRKFQASDTNFMGELILFGKFIQIPEFLFFRRMHEQASSWNRKDIKVQRDFWNPHAKSFNYQYIKRHFAYYSDVLAADIPTFEKIKILKFLLKRTRLVRGHLWADFIYSLKHEI